MTTFAISRFVIFLAPIQFEMLLHSVIFYESKFILKYSTLLLQIYLEFRLKDTWDWLLTVMDATEAQLRFGASLTHSSDLTHPGHPMNSIASSSKLYFMFLSAAVHNFIAINMFNVEQL